MLALIAVVSAAAVALGGGGEMCWLCLPGMLVAGSRTADVRRGAAAAAVVLAACWLPTLAMSRLRPPPMAALLVAVSALSVAVVLALRRRWESERRALERAACIDHLTGIANRAVLKERVDYEIDCHRRARRRFVVVLLDLDGFKQLNDRFGHGAGDELLRDVARALRATVRAQDTVARLGGDEFCVLAPETGSAGGQELLGRLLGGVRRVAVGIESVSASGGLALFPDDGTTGEALLHRADERLIAAKLARGRARLSRAA